MPLPQCEQKPRATLGLVLLPWAPFMRACLTNSESSLPDPELKGETKASPDPEQVRLRRLAALGDDQVGTQSDQQVKEKEEQLQGTVRRAVNQVLC